MRGDGTSVPHLVSAGHTERKMKTRASLRHEKWIFVTWNNFPWDVRRDLHFQWKQWKQDCETLTHTSTHSPTVSCNLWKHQKGLTSRNQWIRMDSCQCTSILSLEASECDFWLEWCLKRKESEKAFSRCVRPVSGPPFALCFFFDQREREQSEMDERKGRDGQEGKVTGRKCRWEFIRQERVLAVKQSHTGAVRVEGLRGGRAGLIGTRDHPYACGLMH